MVLLPPGVNKFLMIGLDHILTERDLAQIRARGATLEHIEHQLVMFHEGIPFAQLDRPCILNDGMISFQPQDLDHFASLFCPVQPSLSAALAACNPVGDHRLFCRGHACLCDDGTRSCPRYPK